MAFKLNKYSYKALRQLNVQERIAAAQDKEMGQWLLSLLTPSQFAELFPNYYRRGLPDVSGFMQAMPSSMSASRQAAIEEQLNNTASGSAAGANFKSGGWKRKWQEGMNEERARASRRDVVPPPQLSPEQRKAFDDLRASPLSADDPRAKMFAGLSAEQMAKVGISKYSEGGKEFYRYTAPTATEEEAKKFISTSQRGGNSFFNAIIKAEGTGKHGDPYETSLGYMKSPKPLTEMTMAESLAWGDQIRSAQGLNSSAKGAFQIVNTTQRAAMNSLGIGMNEKFSPENQRKMAAWIAQQQGLGAWEGLKIHRDQWQIAEQGMSQGLHKQYIENISGDYSQKNIQLAQERLVRQLEERRITSLAEFTTAQLPTPGSAEAQAMIGDSRSATAVAEKIKNEYGNLSNPQCVALAKAYVGASGSVTDWRRGTNALDGTLRPGTPIATFMDRSGNPSNLYDAGGTGAPGNHTTHAAVFLDYVRDGAGKITGIKVMEQYAGSGGAKEKVYPIGGFGTNNAGNYYSINDTKGVPLGTNNPMLQTSPSETPPAAKPPVPSPAMPAPQVETPQALNKVAAAPTSVPEAPKITSERYNVDMAKFLAKIKEMDWRANMASDSMIISGFNDDPRVKAAGVHLDEKGVMHFKNGSNAQVKEVMDSMNAKSFMTKIEEKKKEEKKKEEKKPEVKPVEQKTVEKPPAPAPAVQAPQVETPKKKEAPKTEAAPAVKTNAAGGDNKVNTEQISAYPIGGLKGDNVVVVNKQEKPLFTMNTNESVTMNPMTDKATVTPSGKERNVSAPTRDNPLEGMFDQFNQSVRELASKFDQNKGVPERKDRPDAFNPEGGAWLNNLNKVTENQFHSPSARRAFYRAGGGETGEPNSGFHYSHGNRS